MRVLRRTAADGIAARTRGDRYQSMRELVVDLRRVPFVRTEY
jgi:hypothetical protein